LSVEENPPPGSTHDLRRERGPRKGDFKTSRKKFLATRLERLSAPEGDGGSLRPVLARLRFTPRMVAMHLAPLMRGENPCL
jgi:hypothetical protein